MAGTSLCSTARANSLTDMAVDLSPSNQGDGSVSSPGQLQPCGADNAHDKSKPSNTTQTHHADNKSPVAPPSEAHLARQHFSPSHPNWFATATPSSLYGFAPTPQHGRHLTPKPKSLATHPPSSAETTEQVDVYNRPLQPGENLFEAVDPSKEPKRFANILYGFTPNPGTQSRVVRDADGKMLPNAGVKAGGRGKKTKSVARARGRSEASFGEDGLYEGSPRGRGQPWSSPEGRAGYGRGGSGGREMGDLGVGRRDSGGEVVNRGLRFDAADFSPRQFGRT
ncbi:hypothetical protein IQ07DRAFT_661940 [Pyrenochaeta sp. DS3sAY3a]|nr:hypothetical protein IQ07DRAFT_661940 [Pyrenochaeta sp. DS3sAY3a]